MLKMEFSRIRDGALIIRAQQNLRKYFTRFKLKVSCCCLCGNSCQKHPLICQYCQADLPYFKYPLVPYDLLQWPAIAALIPQKNIDHLIAVAPYVWPFDTWISQLKYQYKTEISVLLSFLLIQHWQRYIITNPASFIHDDIVILAVPLHIKKWQARGFNQAHLIANNFAKAFGYDYQTHGLIREKYTENQVGKSGVERRKNLKNAFSCELSQLAKLPKHVILIDDVVTTGTTANEICQLLKKQGVQKITLLTLCIALPN